MPINWKKVPQGKLRVRAADNKDNTVMLIVLPRKLHEQMRAVADQLHKDRKTLTYKTFERPLLPSMRALVIKALELMLFPDDKEIKK